MINILPWNEAKESGESHRYPSHSLPRIPRSQQRYDVTCTHHCRTVCPFREQYSGVFGALLLPDPNQAVCLCLIQPVCSSHVTEPQKVGKGGGGERRKKDPEYLHQHAVLVASQLTTSDKSIHAALDVTPDTYKRSS